MGVLKNILKRFACKSKCTFNASDFDEQIKHVDLTKYQLKVSDLMRIQKIINKRPSIANYYHDINSSKNTTEI